MTNSNVKMDHVFLHHASVTDDLTAPIDLMKLIVDVDRMNSNVPQGNVSMHEENAIVKLTVVMEVMKVKNAMLVSILEICQFLELFFVSITQFAQKSIKIQKIFKVNVQS